MKFGFLGVDYLGNHLFLENLRQFWDQREIMEGGTVPLFRGSFLGLGWADFGFLGVNFT